MQTNNFFNDKRNMALRNKSYKSTVHKMLIFCPFCLLEILNLGGKVLLGGFLFWKQNSKPGTLRHPKMSPLRQGMIDCLFYFAHTANCSYQVKCGLVWTLSKPASTCSPRWLWRLRFLNRPRTETQPESVPLIIIHMGK